MLRDDSPSVATAAFLRDRPYRARSVSCERRTFNRRERRRLAAGSNRSMTTDPTSKSANPLCECRCFHRQSPLKGILKLQQLGFVRFARSSPFIRLLACLDSSKDTTGRPILFRSQHDPRPPASHVVRPGAELCRILSSGSAGSSVPYGPLECHRDRQR